SPSVGSPGHRSPTDRPPREAVRHLERLLDLEDQRLDARRFELSDLREAIRALTASVTRSSLHQTADLEFIPADLAADVLSDLISSAAGEMLRNVTMTVDYGPGLEDERIRDAQQRMADGQVMRTIYPLSVLDSASGRRFVGAWAEAGEEQRFVAEPPSEFLIFGSVAVFACAEWNEPESDYVVIREPMLIAAFTALHDTVYRSAVALGPDGQAHPSETRLIDLMAMGVKDEAIARTLGWSLRTVRRRIAALMDEHGVQTRFQLGAALLAHGRLESGPLPLSPIRASSGESKTR
ncbi:MAG: hypothetical protein Q4G67_14430, partial [Actinomycetia bacterium]|nr:hypothetical protein [Actinomycetes bacterium]